LTMCVMFDQSMQMDSYGNKFTSMTLFDGWNSDISNGSKTIPAYWLDRI